MARPRNEALYNSVRNEAFRQLFEQGYKTTSYTTIARACGTTRAIVQDYFPKKREMALAAIADLTEIAFRAAAAQALPFGELDDELAKIAQMDVAATCFFQLFQEEERPRRFLGEFIENRDNAEVLIIYIMNWAFGEAGHEEALEPPAQADDLIASLGGFYELVYYHFKHGGSFDVCACYAKVTVEWMRVLGRSEQDIAATLQAVESVPAEARAAVIKSIRRTFKASVDR